MRIKLSVTDEYLIEKRQPFSIFNKIHAFEKNKAVAFYSGYDEKDTFVIVFENGKISTIIHPYSFFAEGKNYKSTHSGLIDFYHDGWLCIFENSRNIFHSSYPFQSFSSIEIKNSLPLFNDKYYPHIGYRVGVSDGKKIMVPFKDMWGPSPTRHYAQLSLDVKNNIAKWNKFNGFFDTTQYASSLSHDGYPKPSYSNTNFYDFPQINHLCIKNRTFYAFAIGPSSSLKYGHEYSAFSKNNLKGKVIEVIFDEGWYKSPHESKKRGKNGHFSSSLKYLIITPQYKASDSWKGKQRLIEIGKKDLIEPIMPRGYSNFNIIEHGHDTFWAAFSNKGETRIISCKGEGAQFAHRPS